MTLPTSGPISLNDICDEYGVPRNTPFPGGFYGKPGFPSSGAFSLSQCYGLSNVLFTPDGGTVSKFATGVVSQTITCNLPAVWTYTGGGTQTAVSIASGTEATSITFQVSSVNVNDVERTWSLTGVSNGVTRNFTVDLTAGGNG